MDNPHPASPGTAPERWLCFAALPGFTLLLYVGLFLGPLGAARGPGEVAALLLGGIQFGLVTWVTRANGRTMASAVLMAGLSVALAVGAVFGFFLLVVATLL